MCIRDSDGGIVHTPYGEYVIVLMNKDFHDIIEYNEHPAMVYGARVSRMILDQGAAQEVSTESPPASLITRLTGTPDLSSSPDTRK